MKKYIIFIVLLSFGCQSHQNAATDAKPSNDNSIENRSIDFLKSKLDDPYSFQLVEFGEFDTLYKNFYSTPEFDKLDKTRDSLRSQIAANAKNIATTIKLEDKEQSISDSIDKMDKAYHSDIIIGYKQLIKYRAKNKFGALVLQANYIYIDTTMTPLEILPVE